MSSAGMPETGDLFAGRYRVEARLGAGAMGVVYRVHDTEIGVDIALKALRPVAMERDEALARFRREVRLARQITHVHVVRTHDLGVHDELPFITMELVEGDGLDAMLGQDKRLEPELAASIALQVARGLHAAHRVDVIHRDLKPSNVIVERAARRAVVTDFGVARSLLGDGDGALTDGAIGTPHYMSPEQVQGLEVDGRTDVYALGGVLYRALTGRLPFIERTPLATALARMTRPVQPLQSLVEALPPPLCALVERCLAREADARPSSGSLVGELEALCEQLWGAAGGRATLPLPLPSVAVDPASDPASDATISASAAADTAAAAGAASLAPTTNQRRGQRLAVLPFRYRGPAPHDYLGEALSDELIDVLARTRGIDVLSSAASREVAGAQPTVPGDAAAEHLVHGTVQLSGETVRISVRLVAAESGLQTWSERFTGTVGDLIALQETMGQRIAEALRVELTLISNGHGARAPREAIELFLQARAAMRNDEFGADERGPQLLDRCLAIAPEFRPAIAARAVATVQRWSAPASAGEQAAREAIDEALHSAGDLSESHLAAAMFAAQCGDYAEAALELKSALRIAPSNPEVLCYLGSLEAQAGRFESGLARLERAFRLDPTMSGALIELTRASALRGHWDRVDELRRTVRAMGHNARAGWLVLEMRLCMWRRELERVSALLDQVPLSAPLSAPLLTLLGNALLGELDTDRAMGMFDPILDSFTNQRFISLVCKVACEFSCTVGRVDTAARYLERAANGVMVDLCWLDHCPITQPVRELAGFDGWRRLVQRRAESFWGR